MGVGVAIDDIFVRLDMDIKRYKKEYEKAVRLTSTNSKKIETEINKSSKAFIRMEKATTAAAAAVKFVGATIVAALGGAAIASIFRAGVAMESINRTFKTVTGSIEGARKEFAFVAGEADRLGANLQRTAKTYASLTAAAKGSSLEGQGTKDIFSAVSEAMVVLGRSSYDTEGALRAIEQMMSKGNVQAEELRGQLGERLPGAFQLAARAMGVTTQELNKMLERGEVMAEDLLPALATELRKTFGEGVSDAVDSAQAAMGRFETSWFNLRNTVFESGGETVSKGFLGALTELFERMSVAIEIMDDQLGKVGERTNIDALFRDLLHARSEVERLTVALENAKNNDAPLKAAAIAAANFELKNANELLRQLQARFDALKTSSKEATAPTPRTRPDEVFLPNDGPTPPKPKQKPRRIALGQQSFEGYEDWLENLQKVIDEAKAKMADAKAEAKSVLAAQNEAFLRATMSEAEYLEHQQEQQLAKYKAYKDKKLISDREYEQAKKELEAEYQKQKDELREEELKKEKERIAEITKNSQQLARDLIDGWEGVKRIALRALDAIIEKVIELANASTSSSGGGLSSILGTILSSIGGSFFGGDSGGSEPDHRASGGAVNSGQLYQVNERGEEFFKSSSNGTVIPMRPGTEQRAGGPNINVAPVFNISTGVQQTVRAELKSMMPQITQATKSSVIDAVGRGGSTARKFREA